MNTSPVRIVVESGGVDWTAIATFALAGLTLVMAGATVFLVQSARQGLGQATMLQLFSTFDTASQVGLEHPHVFHDVHGIDNSMSEREARNLAYLGLLLDAFQHFYQREFKGDFRRMEAELKTRSTYLNRILAHPPNKNRWGALKHIFYGDFDQSFVAAIDALIDFEADRAISGS